jgi:parallel beta-helix repeat protein
VTPGFYYWDGSVWKSLAGGSGGTQDDDWFPYAASNTDQIYHEGPVNAKMLNKVAIVGANGYANIQDAINALPATGGKVFVTEGTWTITSQITFPNNNITIEGAGKNTILQTSNNINIFYVDGRDNIEFKNMTITYNSFIQNNSRNAIYLRQAHNCVVTDCNILKAERGVYLAGTVSRFSENNNVYDNYLDSCRYGISTSAGITPTTYYVRRNMVHNNKIYHSSSYGVCFAGTSTSNTISDNEIDVAIQGIAIFHSDSNIISNNRVLNVGFNTSPGVGICVQGSSNNYITDNYISGVTGTVSNASGIRVLHQNSVYCNSTTITGNQIHLNGTMTGILVTSPVGAVISDNYIYNTSASNAYPAIMVNSAVSSGSPGLYSPTNVVISNNVVNASTTATTNTKTYSGIMVSGNNGDTDNGPRYCTVTGNSVKGYRRGITVCDGDRVIVNSNNAYSNTNGIYFNNNLNSTIIGNNSGGLGIDVTGSTGQIMGNQ